MYICSLFVGEEKKAIERLERLRQEAHKDLTFRPAICETSDSMARSKRNTIPDNYGEYLYEKVCS